MAQWVKFNFLTCAVLRGGLLPQLNRELTVSFKIFKCFECWRGVQDKKRSGNAGVCVCLCVCSCPSLHVSTRQLKDWPCRLRRSLAHESMGTFREEKTGIKTRTRTWFNSLHTYVHSVMVRGFTSPRPEQRSMLNFDPSHYLPRRWGLGWGDNLWTLTFNPGAWAGLC